MSYRLIPCIVIAVTSMSLAQPNPVYKDPSKPISARVYDLLGRMTPEEKFWQLFMIPGDLSDGKEKYKNGIFGLQVRSSSHGDAGNQLVKGTTQADALESARKINSIQKYFVEETRLGIPIILFEEALHGLIGPEATSFPVPIGLAATWDLGLMGRTATAIANETKSRGIRDILSPVLNISPDPRWGRTEETYGEDPFLASEMGVAFVTPFEKMGILTTPKHFLANSGDGGRDSYPIGYSESHLEEYFLPPFHAAIARGGSRSIMTSYNSINGSPSSASDWLLNKKLKGDMNFRGIIISDAGAVGGANVLHFTSKTYEDATVNAMNGGAHVIFQTSWEHHKLFMPPFLDGRIDRSVIDSAVARILRAKFELGLFENPYANESEVKKWTANADVKAMAREAALKSMVLLKNENKTLPFASSVRSVVVIGSDAVEGRLGGYSRNGKAEISILEGIRKRLGNGVTVSYFPGNGRTKREVVVVPASSLSGLKGAYFNSIDLGGAPVVERTEKDINFRWTLYAPHPSVNFDFFSVRLTGKLKPPISGNYKIGLEGNDGYRLYIDNKLIVDNWKSQTYSRKLAEFTFEKGREYELRAECFESSGISTLRLVWTIGADDEKVVAQRENEAVSAVYKAEAVVVVAGVEEGEGLDRASLSLPGYQESLINHVSYAKKPMAVVLIGGSAITMNNWIENVPSILLAWYPGDQGGAAVADALFGDYNPAGRLPISFPVSEGQLPYTYNHKPTGRNDDYADLTGQPLFPFGFGLSYSTFTYSDLKFDKQEISNNESTVVRFNVKNSGTRDGEEVIQLYVRDVIASVAQPIKQLRGFQRVLLKAGEEREFSFTINNEVLQMLNSQMQWVVEPGEFRIMIGASSRDIRLRGILSVK